MKLVPNRGPQMLFTTMQNVVALATWHPRFVHQRRRLCRGTCMRVVPVHWCPVDVTMSDLDLGTDKYRAWIWKL